MIQEKEINRYIEPRETLFFYDNKSQLHSKFLFINGIAYARVFSYL